MHGKFYASMALATHDQSLSREASFQKKLLFIVPAAAREYMRSLVLALSRREILGNDLKHFLIHSQQNTHLINSRYSLFVNLELEPRFDDHCYPFQCSITHRRL